MAFILWSETAFDMRHIGLNALFAAATASDQATTDLVGTPLDFTVGATVFTTPGHTMQADTLVTVHAATDTLIWGTGLVHDAVGTFSAGTISYVHATNFDLQYVTLRAASLAAAAATVDEADDFALFQRILKGNDMVASSAQNDVIYTGAGKDLINDYGGSDRFYSGAGDDYVSSGDGNDRVFGAGGHDFLSHFAGRSQMNGGAGDDTIEGGWDKDQMSGGSGADRFVFYADHGHDTVTDFTHGDDRLVLADTVAVLADLTVVQLGADAKISLGQWSVVLLGVDAATLTEADFIFDQPDFVQAGQAAFFTGWDYV